jgi:hypothetical protein
LKLHRSTGKAIAANADSIVPPRLDDEDPSMPMASQNEPTLMAPPSDSHLTPARGNLLSPGPRRPGEEKLSLARALSPLLPHARGRAGRLVTVLGGIASLIAFLVVLAMSVGSSSVGAPGVQAPTRPDDPPTQALSKDEPTNPEPAAHPPLSRSEVSARPAASLASSAPPAPSSRRPSPPKPKSATRVESAGF